MPDFCLSKGMGEGKQTLPGPVGAGRFCYNVGMAMTAKELLKRVASWPEEDIQKLDEAMLAIEAWRNGDHHRA
jgi:hypothetical protein